jgi:MFS family permease
LPSVTCVGEIRGDAQTLANGVFIGDRRVAAAEALGDRFGARKILLVGFVLFTAADSCGLAPTLATLIMARIIQGAEAERKNFTRAPEDL